MNEQNFGILGLKYILCFIEGLSFRQQTTIEMLYSDLLYIKRIE